MIVSVVCKTSTEPTGAPGRKIGLRERKQYQRKLARQPSLSGIAAKMTLLCGRESGARK